MTRSKQIRNHVAEYNAQLGQLFDTVGELRTRACGQWHVADQIDELKAVVKAAQELLQHAQKGI